MKILTLTSLLAFLLIQCNVYSQQREQSINMSYLDKSISPAEDFFLFSNGTWVKNTKIPASESRWGSFNELDKSNKLKLTEILKNAKKAKDEKGSTNQILGDYYSSYMNFKQRDKKSLDGLSEELKEISNIQTINDILTVIVSHHKIGVRSMFSFGVGQDLKNVDKHVCYLGQSGIGLPNKDYYFNENKKSVLEAYRNHVLKGFEILGKSSEEARTASKNTLEIEIQLAKSMLSPAELRVPENTYNIKTVEQTSALFGAFRFPEYLRLIGFESIESLVVSNPEYLTKCSDLISRFSIEKWQDYLTWNLFNKYAGHLSSDIVKYNFDFYGGVLRGKKELKDANDRCIDEITNMEFGELLGKAFVEKYFSEAAQKKVNQMVDNLLSVYASRINNLEWMSAETKKEALNKLSSIGRKLGYPSKWNDYSSLNFTSNNYLNNIKEITRFSIKKNHSKLYEEVDRDEWGMPAHMVNAYYHPLLNEIAFPAGIMQAPFFDENYEDAVNYGRIGMVIGHEFTHGFDDMGSKFAADGSFKNWWTKEDRELFEQKTKIYGETFEGFCPFEDHCVQSDLTMGENIADLGGLIMAFHAFKKTKDGKENKIKHGGFTAEQRFFISYAQLWKIKYTDEEMKNRIATDPHSPGMYRVNGPLMNCTEFFNAFGVKDGDKMRNPKGKISKIW